MKYFFLIFASSFLFVSVNAQKVTNLMIEKQTNPIGIVDDNPNLSWIITSNKRDVIQVAYQVMVATSEEKLVSENVDMWNSGKVYSEESVYIPYNGGVLKSGEQYFWKVKIWTNKGETKWSSMANWRMGLLNESDWKAQWIQPEINEDTIKSAPMFRKEFSTEKQIKSAIAYITSYGWYEAKINGKRIGDAFFTPGWTSYKTRLQYQMYDVTSLLNQGDNAVGVTLGNGWYREKFLGTPIKPSKNLSLLFQLQITFRDGSTQLVVTNNSWKTSTGSVLDNGLYLGQVYDGRLKKKSWTLSHYNDSEWNNAKELNLGYLNLINTQNELVKKHESFKAIKLIITPKGEKVLDFGQNLVGFVRFKINGETGEKITISHAEILDEEGNFYTENLRKSTAQAIYYLKGNGEETLEPAFSFFGFRYIRIEGHSGIINPDNFTAIALYSDMQPTGSFDCSSDLVNQLQHNIQWGQKGNFIDVPTDCPQRDERLGWTGDAQAFSRTATFNMNAHNFFSKWLKDLKADQKSNGIVPWVIPNVLPFGGSAASGWADAATIVPWNLYLSYGDKQILKNQYESMKDWVSYMNTNSENDLFTLRSQFGDWLFYSPIPDDKGMAAVTNKDLISQCFYAYSTQLLINTAKVLDKKEDIQIYTKLLQKIKNAFLNEFITPNGRIISETQTAYVLTLHFDMLPQTLRPKIAAQLVANIKKYRNHLTTGFLGTPYIAETLTRFGYTDIAYKLLFQKTYPSWLYPVTKGATTIWERWDGIKPDGSLQTPSMNSYNHYAYGAIGDWLYRYVAGLDTDKEFTGYKKIKIKPHIHKKLTYANASLKTYYGKVSSHWKNENKVFTLKVEIPVNTKAVVSVPSTKYSQITESGKKISKSNEIMSLGYKDGYSLFEVGSGKYEFTVINFK